jgi:NMD protein affecting ribosome stability and mRNA decay
MNDFCVCVICGEEAENGLCVDCQDMNDNMQEVADDATVFGISKHDAMEFLSESF